MLVQLFEKVIFSLVSIWFFDDFPFVYCYHHWSPLLYHRSDKIEIVQNHRRISIHHIYHNVALLYMCHRADLHFTEILLFCFV